MNASERAADAHQDEIRARWQLTCETCRGAVCPDTGRCACDSMADAFDAVGPVQITEEDRMMFDRLQFEETGS